MTKITIDARFYGTKHTGLGRYTTNILNYLPHHLKNYTITALLRKDQIDNYNAPSNVTKIVAEIPHYSMYEQLYLPKIIKKTNPDLLYTLHFNSSIFVKTPTIVTIHDLIKSHFSSLETTTRSYLLYSLKRFGYNLTINHAISKSTDIITPTNTVKNNILSLFPTTNPNKIHPIPEAPDFIFANYKKNDSRKIFPKKYVLFVGNAYPHKNIPIIFEALKDFPDLSLVMISKKTFFLDKILSRIDTKRVYVYSDLNDLDLLDAYKNAEALITPSFMEGYGLVGIEALTLSTPVIASNIPVYREVYKNNAIYFDPLSAKSLVEAITSVKNFPRKRITFLRNWNDVAKDIAKVIHARCHSL